MKTSVADFLASVKNDAAVQEQVAAAAKDQDPIETIRKVAAAAGFELTAEDLRAVFSGELDENALESLAGGLASPNEMFAEMYRKKS